MIDDEDRKAAYAAIVKEHAYNPEEISQAEAERDDYLSHEMEWFFKGIEYARKRRYGSAVVDKDAIKASLMDPNNLVAAMEAQIKKTQESKEVPSLAWLSKAQLDFLKEKSCVERVGERHWRIKDV